MVEAANPDSRDPEGSLLGVRVVRDGSDLRVHFSGASRIVPGTSPEVFLEDLKVAYDGVALDETRTTCNGVVLAFSAPELEAVRVGIALHWMMYCLSIGKPMRVTPADVRNPQTWGIIFSRAESKYGARSEAAFVLTAHAAGIELNALKLWRGMEDERQGLM